MTRIDEINARMAAIAQEIDAASGDALTALETEVNSLTAERTALEAEIQSRQALRARVASGAVAAKTVEAPKPAETTEDAEIRAFAGYIRGTVQQMRSGEQNLSMTNGAGVLPTSVARRIVDKVKEICPILAGADVYHVNGTLKVPVWGNANSTHNIAVGYASEFEELTADSGAFGSVSLGGYLIGALTLVSRSLINSADVDVVSWIVDKMARSIAAYVEGELLAGSGSGNNHCTGALATSNTMNAGSTSAISADNLIELQGKIPQIYQANACWTMNPATWTAVKKLKYGDGTYIAGTDFSLEFPYRLLGKPVYLSENMPTITSAAKAVLYGDYSGLAVNIHEDISVEVLREKYATQHAVGVVGWIEIDSNVADAQKLATLVMSVG